MTRISFNLRLVLYIFMCIVSFARRQLNQIAHPLRNEFLLSIDKCKINETLCDDVDNSIGLLAAKLANEHSALMIIHEAQSVFKAAVQSIPKDRSIYFRLIHILCVLAFSNGDLIEAQYYWDQLNHNELVSKRSHAAQVLIGGNEADGINLMLNYTSVLGDHFYGLMSFNKLITVQPTVSQNDTKNTSSIDISGAVNGSNATEIDVDVKKGKLTRSASTEDTEEMLLNILLSEAQGGVRITVKISDLVLAASDIRVLDARQRFRLGVGLAKLGLFDLSLRHVSLSATPWEAPLYRFRAKLVFSPIHASVRSLAMAVEAFIRQGESILMQRSPRSQLMTQICNSPNEAALALQALPLLHLAGFSAPRDKLWLGHSPVALPVLLSEVFLSMCPAQEISPVLQMRLLTLHSSTQVHNPPSVGAQSPAPSTSLSAASDPARNEDTARRVSTQRELLTRVSVKTSSKHLVIGIVAGSLDTSLGRIIVGVLESISRNRAAVTMVAMCFPTPRDGNTDRANALFDQHVNLSPHNKTQAIERILSSAPDVVIFVDAALDGRVFTLAHERLALWQGALWGWGGTLGLPGLDFYLAPEVLWSGVMCHMPSGKVRRPQEVFVEQVVLLEGIPPLPAVQASGDDEMRALMRDRYLLPPFNSTHIYLFPGSVKHLHPEFDAALVVLLRTDPQAMVVLAVPRSGRDSLPTTHIAVRHDLMHPTMPAAAVAKLRTRLQGVLGDMIDRVRVLPPLDERVYRSLVRQVVAVLDPFPVGMSVPILEALMDGVPVVSAPAMQECTNSHTQSLTRALKLGVYKPRLASDGYMRAVGDGGEDDTGSVFRWPTTAEEYAVLALRMSRDRQLRWSFKTETPARAAHTGDDDVDDVFDLSDDEVDDINGDDGDDVGGGEVDHGFSTDNNDGTGIRQSLDIDATGLSVAVDIRITGDSIQNSQAHSHPHQSSSEVLRSERYMMRQRRARSVLADSHGNQLMTFLRSLPR